MFIRFDTIHERDGHTNRQADRQTPHDDTGRACIASRGKKESETTGFAALCVRSELGMRRVHPWVGLGRVGSGRVGLGHKILRLGLVVLGRIQRQKYLIQLICKK